MHLADITRTLLFWPSVFLIRGGIALVSMAETPIGRFSIRPLFRVFCRFVLYTRPIPFLWGNSPSVLPTKELSAILDQQNLVAVMPCACRAGNGACHHPLHTPHESDVCVTVGLGALLQVGSGLGKRIDGLEARALFERAADSGLAHHVVYSLGQLLEICNCCPETCAAILAYRQGVPEAVRPAAYLAVRGPECNTCSDRRNRICVTLCPYGKEPSNVECLGCGLCARHCPQKAIEIISRIEASATDDAEFQKCQEGLP